MNEELKEDEIRIAQIFFKAAYSGDTEEAKACLEECPQVINTHDFATGLTALHLSIFFQHDELVTFLANHRDIDIWHKDRFGRAPTDMLIYTTNWTIFDAVMDRAYGKDETVDDGTVYDENEPPPETKQGLKPSTP